MIRLDLDAVFRSPCVHRDNFLSRAFAMFAEEPARLWAEMDASPYQYLGRPTIYPKDCEGSTTLDFAFQRRVDGCCFVSELKCELAYRDYRYMTLTSADQVERHRSEQLRAGKKSFPRFLETATRPEAFSCRITTRTNRQIEKQISGAILVWGKVTAEGREVAMRSFGFADVLSIESMVNELLQARYSPYLEFVRKRQTWCDEMFVGLLGGIDNR